MFVLFALSGVCTVCETTVDLQVRALMFIQCGVLWFCYVFTLFYVSRRRDLANILSHVGTSCHRGTQLRCRRGSRADQLPKVGPVLEGRGYVFRVCALYMRQLTCAVVYPGSRT